MGEAEQLPLDVQRAARPSRRSKHAKHAKHAETVELAARRPIAKIRVDAHVPHLDRDFDYSVPATLNERAVVGARVRVRFSGRLVDGFITGRTDAAAVSGELRSIERVIGAEPVLTAEVLALVEAVAERYAGTFSDVVRSAVPPRHARAEAREVEACTWQAEPADLDAWNDYTYGRALLERLGRTEPAAPVRAAWSAAPGHQWEQDILRLVHPVLAQATGGVLIIVPDATDVERMLLACRSTVEVDAIAVLTADSGPERRYGQFLRVLRGGARVVIGTRTSVFAPVHDLRLIVVWDDGDESHCDPQAPYWETRDVAALRSHVSGCHLVVGSPARSVVSQQWCASGWARSVTPTKAMLSAQGPRVTGVLDSDVARDPAAAVARMPHRAWETARKALETGAVLVQVARRGYVPALACQDCRTAARCECGGPLAQGAASGHPTCSWCGAIVGRWTCGACGSRRLRAGTVGAERTAEEIGRAFPGVPILSSNGSHRLLDVDPVPSIVIATQGTEPRCPGGFASVIVLDARSALQRVGLDAHEEAVRRWMTAAALAAPRAPVVIAADNQVPAVQALVRWDPAGWAQRELADRTSAGLPPAVRMAELLGDPAGIREVAEALTVPHRLLGPVPAVDRHDPQRERGLVTVDREFGPSLGRELRAITATRSARGRSDRSIVHVHLDPRSP